MLKQVFSVNFGDLSVSILQHSRSNRTFTVQCKFLEPATCNPVLKGGLSV